MTRHAAWLSVAIRSKNTSLTGLENAKNSPDYRMQYVSSGGSVISRLQPACQFRRALAVGRQRDIGPRVFGRPVFLSIAPQHQSEQAVGFRPIWIAGQQCTAGGNHLCVLPAPTIDFGQAQIGFRPRPARLPRPFVTRTRVVCTPDSLVEWSQGLGPFDAIVK